MSKLKVEGLNDGENIEIKARQMWVYFEFLCRSVTASEWEKMDKAVTSIEFNMRVLFFATRAWGKLVRSSKHAH